MDAARERQSKPLLGVVAAGPRRPTARLIADRIVTAIALGEFVPGQKLPAERDLAEQLGVSRTTVRDALARVTSLDLLEVRRGRTGGAYVQSSWSTTSADAVRKILEPQWAARPTTTHCAPRCGARSTRHDKSARRGL